MTNELIYISMDEIVPNASQPRATFQEKALIELADSIRAHGVLEPILVVRAGVGYKVIAGERRYRAACLAGLKNIPAIIIKASERELWEIAITENLQRQNLNPIEEAQAIQALIEVHQLTQEQAAMALGRSRPAISNLLRILTLPLDVQEMVRQGKLSQGHARALLSVNDPKKIISMANLCVENKWSVHALTQEIARINAPKGKKKKISKEPRQSIEMRDFIEDMERVFQMPIKVKGDEHRGTLTIHYGSLSDLQRLYDIIEGLKNGGSREGE
jgi:ParB family chromosome partitioning protein